MMKYLKTAADFFAGIGLVTLGLQKQGWNVVYAVDHSEEKQKLYVNHFGVGHYHLNDIKKVTGIEVPNITLAHASFPCTNTSVAGSRSGLHSGESSTFWEFIRILKEMKSFSKIPPFVMIENVEGLLSSGAGKDLTAILTALNELGYCVDILLVDAAYFVPQSRLRLFIMASLISSCSNQLSQQFFIENYSNARPQKIMDFIVANPHIKWSIRDIPLLPNRVLQLNNIVDLSAQWWCRERSDYLFNQMFDRHKKIIYRMTKNNYWSYGTVFRRMRQRDGIKQSTAELRTDGIAGCLRTPKGGSARQIIIRAGKGQFDARLINEVESARLMGAVDYTLPTGISLNSILFGFGDAVCVPVIEWIAKYYLNPMFNELAMREELILTS